MSRQTSETWGTRRLSILELRQPPNPDWIGRRVYRQNQRRRRRMSFAHGKMRRGEESGVRLGDAIHIGTPLQSSSGNHGFAEHERPIHGQGVGPPDRSVGGGDARQSLGGDQERAVADAEPAGRSGGVVGKGGAAAGSG